MNDTPPSDDSDKNEPLSPESFDQDKDIIFRKSIVGTENSPLRSHQSSPKKLDAVNPYSHGVFDRVKFNKRSPTSQYSAQIQKLLPDKKQIKIESRPVV